jgi:hypothetical protein
MGSLAQRRVIVTWLGPLIMSLFVGLTLAAGSFESGGIGDAAASLVRDRVVTGLALLVSFAVFAIGVTRVAWWRLPVAAALFPGLIAGHLWWTIFGPG